MTVRENAAGNNIKDNDNENNFPTTPKARSEDQRRQLLAGIGGSAHTALYKQQQQQQQQVVKKQQVVNNNRRGVKKLNFRALKERASLKSKMQKLQRFHESLIDMKTDKTMRMHLKIEELVVTIFLEFFENMHMLAIFSQNAQHGLKS